MFPSIVVPKATTRNRSQGSPLFPTPHLEWTVLYLSAGNETFQPSLRNRSIFKGLNRDHRYHQWRIPKAVQSGPSVQSEKDSIELLAPTSRDWTIRRANKGKAACPPAQYSRQ